MRSIQLPVLALWVGQSTSEQKCADETTLLQGLKKMQDSVRRFNSELGIDTMPIPGNNPCHSRSEPVESPQLGRDFHFLFSGQKCPHRHSDRLFRKPETGSNHDSFTVEACYRFCAEHENCNYFSFGDHNGGKVCMGCVSLQNAQIHDGFDVYDMVSTEAETAVDVMEWNDTRSVADAVTAVAGPLVHVLIDNSNENTKCVTAPVPVICADNAGHFGNRLNTHTAGDEFEIRVDGAEVCATRTDSSNGWGMHLEIACAAAPVHILIDRSSENTKCVRHSFPVSCAGDSGNLDNRINSHQAGDTFDITTSVDLIGPKICATRTDSGAGWGMRLEIACVAASGEELQGQIVATPAINILIDNSNENIKCVEASLPVICAGDAGQLGNRINSHNAGDTFEITTDGTQVCARRTDSTNGWGMHLEITCMAAPVRVLIDSSGENTKCVTASYPVTCADDAGHLGSRVNSHQADDTFEITSNGVEVCATRTDAPVGWGMHLEIVCVATAGMGTCADQGRYIRHDVGTAIYWEKCGVKYWVQSCSMCDNILDFAHTPCHNHWVDQPQSYIDSLLTGGGFRSADGERFQCSQHWAYNTEPTHDLTEPTPSCCLALEASCLACQALLTIEEFCVRSPLTQGCPIMPDVDQGDLATLHWNGGSFTIPAGQEGICLVRGPETFPNDLVDRVSGLRNGCEVDLYQHGCPGGRVGTTTGLTSDQGGLLGLEITALSVTCHPVDPPVGLATVHWNGGFFTIPDEQEGDCLSRGSATFPNDQVASITDMRDGCTVEFYQHGCPGGRVGTITHVTEPRSDLFDLEITALKLTCSP